MTGAPDDSVHRVALFQKQFGQIRAILTCDPSNQRNFVGILHLCRILHPNFLTNSAREINHRQIPSVTTPKIWRVPVTREGAADTAYDAWRNQPGRADVETACEQVL